MADALITHVSDTARWVAAIRARESARPDALFRDTLADGLAGAQGHAIAASAPRMTRSGWPIVTRTRLIDDLISASLLDGCDRVLNLAAGLDTRPYRLDLPATLQWIEADLTAVIDAKEGALAGHAPRCQLSRERVDLADAAERRAFLERATAGATRALVITEGLLVYLDERDVRAIAADLSRSPIRWWITDAASPRVIAMNARTMRLDHAPMKFAPPNGVAWFEAIGGWRARDICSYFEYAKRWRRLPTLMRLFSFLPGGNADPRNLGQRAMWGAAVRFERD